MNNAVFVAIGAAAALLAALVFYQSKKRSADIRALAARIGFAYLSSELPTALVLPDDPFSKIGAIWNVIDGEKDGIRVVAFDYRIGSSKGSWGGTVIAAQTAGTAFERLFLKWVHGGPSERVDRLLSASRTRRGSSHICRKTRGSNKPDLISCPLGVLRLISTPAMRRPGARCGRCA